MSHHLILIGYRGVGKSTIAQLLSEKTGMPLISTDREIEKKLGKSIFDYIQAGHSWDSFRRIEGQVVRDCVQSQDAIIDCGGGVVERPANIKILRASGRVFWLTASIPTLLERMKSSGPRPSLSGGTSSYEEVGDILARRQPRYQKASHVQIDTEGDKLLQAPDEILKHYRI